MNTLSYSLLIPFTFLAVLHLPPASSCALIPRVRLSVP